ncbi:MAG: putative peptidoglycan glycosyltransferase FtsW [Dialister sp.]|nr:putative peptidoglycan glycosyltransferase FtsW [Dialister sp.]
MPSGGEASNGRMRYVPNSLRLMIIIAGVLLGLGGLNLYSATYYMNIHSGVGAYDHLLRHCIFLAIGIGIAFLASRCDYRLIRKGRWVWAILTVFLLLMVMVAGRTINGATRWLQIGSLSLQPSEIAKVAALIWTSSYLAELCDAGQKICIFERLFTSPRRGRKKRSRGVLRDKLLYFKPLWLPSLLFLLVLKQPDMGTAGMILIFPGLLYILAGMPVIEIVGGLFAAFAAFLVLVVSSPYRLDRLIVLWDPFPYAADKGYQTVQSLIAVGSGGFIGQGLGRGLAKYLYLPEQYTDFAFAVFSQEFGFIGSLAVLLLFVCFLFCGFSVARRVKDTYGALLIYGLSLLIAGQGMINIAMVAGCFPVTGIPLPFISYGGTSLVVNLLALGLIWGTATQSIKRSEEEERRRRIAAMAGHPASLGRISGSVFHPGRGH